MDRGSSTGAGELTARLTLALGLLSAAAGAAWATDAPDRHAIDPKAAADVPVPQLISDEVLSEEYNAYRQSVKGMKMYRVSYILLADEDSARDWLKRIRSGAGFENVAREHSKHQESALRGGALGTFATCRWAKDTVAMLDELRPGQIYKKPVKASHGWALYRLDDVQPLKPLSFAQYKTQLLEGSFKPECPWVPPVNVGVPRRP
ncbi:MAG: peptidylprolyl isomerase [Lautropia sp.]|nr:peptidylprolyl isomerase [Lautropia sp.]